MLIIPILGIGNNDLLTLIISHPNCLFIPGHVWFFNKSEMRKSLQDV